MSGVPVKFGLGGGITISSGTGKDTSSRSLVLNTFNAGTSGVSGSVTMSTGDESSGSSGSMILSTGSAVYGTVIPITVSVMYVKIVWEALFQ